MNMKKGLFAGIAVVCAVAAFAAPAFNPKNLKPGDGVYDKNGKKLTREEFRAALYRHNGGKIKVPGIQKGVLNYVNCNNAVNPDWLATNATAFAKAAKIEIGVVEGKFEFPSPEIKGDASLFVIDDPKMPSLLIAPEQKWAMVNVAPLKSGRGEKPAFYYARVQKELTRGFAMLAGASKSNYPQSLTGCVTKPEDLDKFADTSLPVDVVDRFAEYLKGYGIVPYQLKTYRQACKEGWAPEPDDDVRKAIWDEVHKLPTAPVKLQHAK